MSNLAKRICFAAALMAAILASASASAQVQRYRSERRVVRGGLEHVKKGDAAYDLADSLKFAADSLLAAADSLALTVDSLMLAGTDSLIGSASLRDSMPAELPDSLFAALPDSLAAVGLDSLAAERLDSLETARADSLISSVVKKQKKDKSDRRPFISDSMGLSRVSWLSAVLPGFGQIYNKQYWKLPILYSTVGASLTMFFRENKKYKPFKQRFDELTDQGLYRTEELNAVQSQMIRHNTLREVYLGAAIASYIFFIGDAAVKYSTNDVSSVKRATTLALICPGAGQVYNKSYWRLPIVLGGFATTIYCIDWNNRGYQRFKKAYRLRADYDINPDLYPDGSSDEFRGRYSATFLKNLRDSYRRNRDLCIILTAGLYILQAVDAHVDAHLRDFDISDDLSMNVIPMVDYAYSPSLGRSAPVFGMGIGINF